MKHAVARRFTETYVVCPHCGLEISDNGPGRNVKPAYFQVRADGRARVSCPGCARPFIVDRVVRD